MPWLRGEATGLPGLRTANLQRDHRWRLESSSLRAMEDVKVRAFQCGGVRLKSSHSGYDQCWPFRKSEAKVPAIADMTAWLEMISPSSRLSLREVLEKFSDPMNTLAWAVP
jgi:hypothetical protein